MTDAQLPKDTLTTLDDLKRAIEKVQRYRQAPLDEALHNAVGWCAAERDAWKTAFFWFHHHMERPDEGKEKDAQYFAEYDEGFRLLKETFR